jgi:hypothetical protein
MRVIPARGRSQRIWCSVSVVLSGGPPYTVKVPATERVLVRELYRTNEMGMAMTLRPLRLLLPPPNISFGVDRRRVATEPSSRPERPRICRQLR